MGTLSIIPMHSIIQVSVIPVFHCSSLSLTSSQPLDQAYKFDILKKKTQEQKNS